MAPPPPSSCSPPHLAPPPTAPTPRPRIPSPPSPSCRCSCLRPPLALAALRFARRFHRRPPRPLPVTAAGRGRRPAAAARLAPPGYTTLSSAAAAPQTHLRTATPSLCRPHAPVPHRSPHHALWPRVLSAVLRRVLPAPPRSAAACCAAAAGRLCRFPPVPAVEAADPRHGLPASRARHAPPTPIFDTPGPRGHGAARGAWSAVGRLLDMLRIDG